MVHVQHESHLSKRLVDSFIRIENELIKELVGYREGNKLSRSRPQDKEIGHACQVHFLKELEVKG